MPSIILALRADDLLLPQANQYAIQGLVYRLLRDAPDYSRMLHDQGYISANRRYKLLTFSRLKGQKQPLGRNILYTGGCRLEIRSPLGETVEILSEALHRRNCVELLGQKLDLIDVRIEEHSIDTDHIRVRMISPLTVHRREADGFVRYLAPGDPEFAARVDANYRRKREAFTGHPAEDSVWIAPDRVTEADRCVTRFKGTTIGCWYGFYQLYGAPEALSFLYDSGLGTRNSQGFGMFSVCE